MNRKIKKRDHGCPQHLIATSCREAIRPNHIAIRAMLWDGGLW